MKHITITSSEEVHLGPLAHSKKQAAGVQGTLPAAKCRCPGVGFEEGGCYGH